jgi:hypothetical protein
VLSITPIIFPHSGPQRGKIIGVVGNNVERTLEVKLEHVCLLLPTARKLFSIVNINAEDLLQRRTMKHFL